MLLVQLIPLKTTKKIETLSYYTGLDVRAGDLVEIAMHGQILPAIIIQTEDVRSSVISVKSSDFKLKKISNIITKDYISHELLSSLHALATLLATNVNHLLSTIMPISKLDKIAFVKRSDLLSSESITRHYILPTVHSLRDFKSTHKTTKISASTPNLNFLLDRNINVIVLCDESSPYYYSAFKNIDIKKAIISICGILNIKVEYEYALPSLSMYKNKYKDMGRKIGKGDEDIKNITTIKMDKSLYLDKRIEAKITNMSHNKVLLFTVRRGMYTQSVCSNCSYVFKCKKCDKPYMLTSKQEVKYHSCNSCKDSIRLVSTLKCPICNNWNIKTLGIGSEGLHEYIKDLKNKNKCFTSDIYRVDTDINNTAAASRHTALSFYKNRNNSIFITTELGLKYLEKETFDLVVIVSIDSMFYIADYNADEKIFFLLSKIKELASSSNAKIFLETRMSQKFIENNLELLTSNEVDNFYLRELEKRGKNNLPPYYNILTFESEQELSTPSYLANFKNMLINTTNQKGVLVRKYVFFVGVSVWENDADLRSKTLRDLAHYDLKLNDREFL